MISLDSYVVVQREKTYRLLKVSQGQAVIDKLKFNFANAIGQPYGTIYLAKNHQLTKIDVESNESASNLDSEQSAEQSFTEKLLDNGNLVQQITREDLSKMKKDGTSSTEIVAKLVEGCSTFKDKTCFAKEKYVARKTKKHSDVIRLFQPTVRLLNEIYYRKDPEKISFLRIDNLSLVLTMANVHSNLKVLVIENCSGLITAAVLERLGGLGVCLNLHKGVQQQGAPCLQAMNFSEQIMFTFFPLPLDDVVNGPKPEDSNFLNENSEKVTDNEEKLIRRERRKKALAFFVDGQFDSMILACKYHPLELLQKLFPKLKTSRPFVIYSPYVQVQ